MADNVIRNDIVKLDFEINGLKEVKKLQDELNALKKKLGGVGDDTFDGLDKGASKGKKALEKVKEQAEKVKKSLSDIGKKAAKAAFNGLKKLAGISFKALTAGVTAVAGAIGGLVTKAVQAYGEYEQLYGGMQTLLGAKGAKNVQEYAKLTGKSVKSVKKEYNNVVKSEKLVMKNANDAYKTAGMSANQYMETVTSFSAALTSSLGGDTLKAAKLANTAIGDMADNANKMGTPLENVSIVYSNLARGMYMTLDNLKLGYSGTKEGAKKLVNDAAKIDKSVKANDISYANLVKAIHAVQVKMDIYGTTGKEAEHTITGSLNAMKASWENLLVAMGSGENLDQCLDNMIDSVKIFGDNVIPVAEKALSSIGIVIEKLAPTISKELPILAEKLLPPLIKAAVELTKGLVKALPNIIKTVVVTIVDILKEQFPLIAEQFPIVGKIADFIKENAGKIAKAGKTITLAIVGIVAAFKLFKGIKAISSVFKSLGSLGGKKSKGSSGIFDIFKELAKLKVKTVLRGMTNLAIILTGMTILTAAFAAVAPTISKIGDTKSFLKLSGMIVVMGLVGTALAKLSEIVGKIPVSKVAKGLANMAIMIVGMSALFTIVGFVAKLDFDYVKILKLSGLITVLGIVGTALSIFAGIVGNIPILTVVKGFANMAIMIAGMTGVLVALNYVLSSITFDVKKILIVAGLITILGTIGAVLSVFAGIVGMIPIPVVLAGLTNMGLVLGGITGLILAYGKLSEIKGFNDFITKGGETLAKIFNVIGKISGSLIGGIGEGVSESLPKIGENISKFVTSLKPMFNMIKGIDMSGVGAFFSALSGFLLKLSANDLLSIFTGGTDFEKLGTGLSTFATKSKTFFTTVSELPENGFTNGKKLFDCLAGMKSLPKEGGVVSWFTGNLNYEGIAKGLGQLSSEKVINFFTAVAKLKQEGFDSATKLFDCLAGMKSLPKEGGVKGWFSGDVNYTNIANGLSALSKDGVKKFFTMTGSLKETAFTNAKKLFESLASMGNLPKSGGLWDTIKEKVSGKETKSQLGAIADDLADFADKAKTFFSQVNSLNLGNLNGLWTSLSNAKKVTADISKKVTQDFNNMVKKATELPKKMGNGIRNSGSALSNAFVSIWKNAVKATSKPVNKLISGANWILKQFGSNKRVASWTPYAKGTDGHKGGNALVNDGRGAEIVQMPNGKSFIPQGKNVFIPNAPKGMKVLPAEQTAQLMGKKSPTFRYANGTGDIDIWDYMDNAKGLISSVKNKFVNYKGTSGLSTYIAKGMVNTISGQMTSWAKKLYDEFGALSLAAYNPSKGVEQWRSTVIRALKMEGQYSEANVKRTLYQMQTESGGNPRAINLWDSNAKKGIPSKGLMQVIDPTFRAYARKGFDKNIYDPLSNILASIRYAVSRYGSLAKAYRGHGYANGGLVTKTGLIAENPYNPEWVIPTDPKKRNHSISLWKQAGRSLGLNSHSPEQSGYYSSNSTENNTYAPVFNLTISGTNDDRTMARKVKRWVSESIEDTFDSYSRRNPKLREA